MVTAPKLFDDLDSGPEVCEAPWNWHLNPILLVGSKLVCVKSFGCCRPLAAWWQSSCQQIYAKNLIGTGENMFLHMTPSLLVHPAANFFFFLSFQALHFIQPPSTPPAAAWGVDTDCAPAGTVPSGAAAGAAADGADPIRGPVAAGRARGHPWPGRGPRGARTGARCARGAASAGAAASGGCGRSGTAIAACSWGNACDLIGAMANQHMWNVF